MLNRVSAAWRSALMASVAAGVICVSGGAALASPILTSDPVLSSYTLQYGDFQVVSLQFADDGTNSNNYYVQSSPGQLRQDIVVGTHAGGTFYNNNLTTMDNPSDTEDKNFPGYFATGDAVSSPDPAGGSAAGDAANSWDITTAALRQYFIDSGTPGANAVFYFNLNENGVDDKLSGTDLLIWAKVTISGPTVSDEVFYLAGNPFDPTVGGPGAGTGPGANLNGRNLSALNGAPDPTLSYPDIASGAPYDPDDARWTVVHGDICVDGSTFLHYGKCDGRVGETAGAHNVNQNLGADQAAFAAYNLQLAADINNPLFTTMHIQWQMAAEDNGYEQLFILASGATQVLVPEPGTVALFGAGLIGLGGYRLRRRRKTA